MIFNVASGLFCETVLSVDLFFVAIQDEREGPINAELSGKVGSSLPVPPEEHKLKDDYIVNVQVSFVALIFNDTPFQTAARNRKPVWSPYCVF